MAVTMLKLVWLALVVALLVGSAVEAKYAGKTYQRQYGSSYGPYGKTHYSHSNYRVSPYGGYGGSLHGGGYGGTGLGFAGGYSPYGGAYGGGYGGYGGGYGDPYYGGGFGGGYGGEFYVF